MMILWYAVIVQHITGTKLLIVTFIVLSKLLTMQISDGRF